MNPEKFTERARGFLQAAQTIALREDHQRLTPSHILKALLDDEQGMAANLIRRAGGAPERVAQANDIALAKIAKVSGGEGQIYMDHKAPR
jgi:ATP-dependent Clp protease ATP-binding subunit ClpB